MRAWVVLVVAAWGCYRDQAVPCDGILVDGEFCDDGNSSDGDGCDCATRMISPAPQTIGSGVPIVVVENGAWCWFQDERAIAVGEQLVVSSISHGGDVQVTSLDLGTGDRTHSILHARLERDDHDVASLLELPDGKVAAFYTRHDGFPHLFTRVTERASDTTAWSPVAVKSFDYDVTYTNPFLDGDRTLVFMRGIETNPTLVATRDNGVRWTDGAQLLDAAGDIGSDHRPYVKYVANDGAIHLLYTEGHPIEFQRNSVYHLVYRDGALWDSTGERIATAGLDDQPSLPPTLGTRIYDGRVFPGGQAWVWDAAIDADGHPVVVFSTYPDPARPFFDHRYRYARFDGTSWQVHSLAHAGTGIYFAEGYYSGGIALDPDDPSIVYFASNVIPASGEPASSSVFELYRGVTTDAGATWQIAAVTRGSRAHNLRPIVPAHHAAPTTLLWMRGSYDSYLDYRTQIVALVGAANATTASPAYRDPNLVALARFDLAATVNGPATPTAPGFVGAVPAAGYAQGEQNGISMLVSNITGTREAVIGDPLYRGLVLCNRGGMNPDDKLRVELAGLTPDAPYLVRIHGHDTNGAYTMPTLWFRGDAKSLDSEQNASLVGAHRNVNNTASGEGFTDLLLHADSAGKLAIVGRGLDYAGNDQTAVLSGLEVLQPPTTTLVARFDVDAAPGENTAPDAVSLSFDGAVAWSGEATANGITVRATSDRIDSLRRRDSTDPMLGDFIFGRDQIAVDVSGLQPGRLYAFTVYSTDLEENLYSSSRWRLDEPGHAPRVVYGFHMNLHRADAGAAFTFYHRASSTSFRLRGEDVMSSLSTNPSLVIFNGIDVRESP